MLKIVKTLLPLSWMCLIYILSDIPYPVMPIQTTNAQQILAHIFLYGVLAYLIVVAVIGWRGKKRVSISNWRLKLLIIAFCIFYGITDEYHQGFVIGRFSSYADLFFDGIGAILGIISYQLIKIKQKPKLLLHICCAGCGAYVSRLLQQGYKVILFFYNPNIFPKEEYDKRLAESKMIAKKFKLKLIEGEYNHQQWLNIIKGHENDPERGERCLICYKDRLEQTAKLAQKKKYNYFSTTLTISPHKDAQAISKIGNELSRKYDILFLNKDFKKRDGFKKSVQLSKKLNLYRQNYCGCEFSRKF